MFSPRLPPLDKSLGPSTSWLNLYEERAYLDADDVGSHGGTPSQASSPATSSRATGVQCMTIVAADRAPIDVLLVDDNPGDVRLAQEAFGEAKGFIKLHVASDGVEALSFLRREAPYASSPRPDLILLDLGMPRMNGPETLAQIRADASLKLIPVVILTISDAEADIVKSYELNANLYLTKPVGLEAILILVKSINDFAWLGQCRISALPP